MTLLSVPDSKLCYGAMGRLCIGRIHHLWDAEVQNVLVDVKHHVHLDCVLRHSFKSGSDKLNEAHQMHCGKN